jgi:hypothetical protein
MLQTEVVEKIKTYSYILSAITFFFENRAVYEIMWKNIVEPDTWKCNMANALCMLDT